MLLSAVETTASRSWPDVILILGLLLFAFLLIVAAVSAVHESRKLKMDSARDAELRRLVDRYEQLAEKTMDAQQRVATDVAELRSRASSIEQILSSVE